MHLRKEVSLNTGIRQQGEKSGANGDTGRDKRSQVPSCLNCGQPFDVDELASIVARRGGDTCVVECPSCSVLNEIEAMPQPGLGAQPVARVLRTRRPGQKAAAVFRETVRP
jgi:hypothetical protein